MAGPPVRERYNSKARGSVAGGSHKKRKRSKVKPEVDQNGLPVVVQEEQHAGDGRGKMSAKKRKRMDSYIDKKLKSEERLKTIKLLASLAPSSSTSAALASTSTLGQNPLMPTTAGERAEKREDRLVRRGIDRLAQKHGEASESDSSDEEESRRGRGKGKQREEILDASQVSELEAQVAPAASPIKANPKKAKKLSKKANWNPTFLQTQPDSDSSSDFDSSDSDNNANDDVSQVGPSSPPTVAQELPCPQHVEPARAGSALRKPVVVSTALGGALKKPADGSAAQPRFVRRRQKMPLGRASASSSSDDDDDADEESNSNEEVTDEDESGEDAEHSADDREAGHQPQPETISRSLGFKNWAMKQMSKTDPLISASSPKPEPPPFASSSSTTTKATKVLPKTGEFVGPLGAKFAAPSSSLLDGPAGSTKSMAHPSIKRRPSVAESRMELPILAEEQAIVEAIRMHPVVIIAGETGSGKTTQVPQMLYEAGFGFKGSDNPGMVAVTQPRRVAAVSLSVRVRSELGLPSASTVVAHQIRYSATTSANTSIKFMTDGVLLRELASDFMLSKYSVIVVDEAHERGVNTDVLIGVLSRVAKLREKKWRDEKAASDAMSPAVKPLRIVIMSATLRIEDFAQNATLFAQPPPVIHIPARQHPVTVHFSRRTISDYVGEAYKKVCKIHARLPPGGVLVFLTGQGEIQQLCRKLEKKYVRPAAKPSHTGPVKQKRDLDNELAPEVREAEEVEFGGDADLAADVDDGEAESDPEALDSDDDEDGLDLDIDEASGMPMHILPLYSLLPNEQQMQVFQAPPEGHRLVIVATNVAETSLTIPGIRYVVDSGRSKERQYDMSSGVQAFQISWISKASASQRAGRAGRTGPGHCYRLYSSALFEDHFAKFSEPEILRMPIEGVVLQMKSMNIDQVINFPFPTPPDRYALRKAEELLTHLGALERPTTTRMIGGVQQLGNVGGRITDLGKAMAGYPVSPRFAKMLCIGDQHGCLPYIVAIVASLSVGDPFLHEQSIEEVDAGDDEEEDAGRKGEISHIKSEDIRAKEQRKDTRRRFFNAQSQFLGLGGGTSDMFKMLAAIGAYEYDPTPAFCANHFLRVKAMQEIQQLRGQISNITKQTMSRLAPPSQTQVKVIRQILTASSLDRVAVRQDVFLKKNTSFSSTRGVAYRAIGLGKEEVFIHPSSALFHKTPPEFVAYHEVTRSAHSGKTWMKGITDINPSWLAQLGKSLCTFSKPDAMPQSKGRGKMDEVKEGERAVTVTPHFGDLGVDLPSMTMKQRREGTRWVLVE